MLQRNDINTHSHLKHKQVGDHAVLVQSICSVIFKVSQLSRNMTVEYIVDSDSERNQ